jgi:hypothetical protein
VKLTDTQRWILRAAIRGTRGFRGLFDASGYGAGIFASARALVRKGAMTTPNDSEFFITSEGRARIEEEP